MTPTPKLEVSSADFFILALFAIGAYLQAHGVDTHKTFYFFGWLVVVLHFVVVSSKS